MNTITQNLQGNDTGIKNTRLELLEKICTSVRPVKQRLPVISSITQMARYALNASAASLFLLDEDNKALLYMFADGPLGKQFRSFHINRHLSVARSVIQNGCPILVNDIAEDERFSQSIDEVTGLVSRSVLCSPLFIKGEVIGALEVLNKLDGDDFSEHDSDILAGLAANVALTIENIRVNEILLYSYKDTVQNLVSALDIRENTASNHSRRVSEYSRMVANKLSLSAEEKQNIESAAILHDIGLLSIPESVLNKRDNLTDEEWNMIRKHPVIGYNLLRGIPSLNQVSKLILYHHERYDGKGYPCGLKGDTIPVGARIIAAADAFDTMTVKHSYRAAMNPKVALAELGKCAGTQFCPLVAKAFFVSYLQTYSNRRVNIKSRSVF
jgi:HD-GYP domain-containing protein (c-di-GMP phosphodiesterase class II)